LPYFISFIIIIKNILFNFMTTSLESEARAANFNDMEDKHNFAVNAGLKGAAVATAVAAVAAVGLTRYSKTFNGIRLPFKVFLGMAVPTFAFFTVSDRAAMHANRAKALKISISQPDLNIKEPLLNAKQFLVHHRYALLGTTWTTTLILALAYNFSIKHLTYQQRIVNARMVAQSAALVGLCALAGLTGLQNPKETRDAHFDSIISKKE
jgi:hypothetical protein